LVLRIDNFKTSEKFFPLKFNIALIVLLFLGCGLSVTPLNAPPWYPTTKGICINNDDKTMEWIKNNTLNNALFLVPPDMATMQAVAHRSVIVSYKAAPIGNGREMLEWAKRLEKISNCSSLTGLNLKSSDLCKILTDLYLNNSPDNIRSIMKYYNADFFITYKNHKNINDFPNQGFVKYFEDETIIIFKK